MAKDFSVLLRQTMAAAQKHAALIHEMNESCVDRYGIGYTDAGVDSMIDAFDYGRVTLSVRECDDLMRSADYPPLREQKRDQDQQP